MEKNATLLPYRLMAKEFQRLGYWKSYLDYERSLVKRERTICRIQFLKSCMEADIIPSFLRFRVPNNGCFEPTVVHNFQRRLLKGELNKAGVTLENHVKKINEMRDILKETVDQRFIPSIVVFTRIAVKITNKEVSSNQRRKLESLSLQQERPLFNVQDTVKLYQLDVKPPQYVLDTLAMGPRNPVLDKFNKKDVLAEIDYLLSRLKKRNMSDDIINEINAATLKYIKSCASQRTPRHIVMTQRYLKENKLLALPFDKGTGICLMKKEVYISKLNDILELKQFSKVTVTRKNGKDLCFKEEERVNTALKELMDAGKIDENLYTELRSTGGQLPRLYGLAKVHKENVPLRPVLSMPGSPYHKVAKKVTEWLNAIPEAKISSSTKQTVDKLKGIVLQPDEIIVSFDVSSLYTNVPVREAIEVAANRLYSGSVNQPPVDKETFVTLATLSCSNVVMSTHSGTYRQIDGLAMGSPPAPPLANIWLSQYDPSIRDDAKIFERYMDDFLRTIKKRLIEKKLKRINSLHPNLKFTLEIENEGKLPFLDMCLLHEGNRVASTWYCKPTDTGLILNFHALAPKKYKRSVIQGFMFRIHRACSSWKYFHESLKKAKDILERNQYPPNYYEPIIKDTLEKIIRGDSSKPDTGEKNERVAKEILVLQYRGVPTEKFIAQLKHNDVPVQVVPTLRKLKTVTPSLKASVKDEMRSGVVYKIVCPGCDACYVGQTSRHLCVRFKEHSSQAHKPVAKHIRR